MPLQVPVIDDRSYQEIFNEALARIPVHNPEWTNFNDSDPGITLLQLFAFMTENLLYRSNLIPERNRLTFLRLLGIPLQPAASAQGIVTFSNPRGPLRPVTLADGLEVFAGQVPFRTLDGLDVLPIEGRVYYKSPLPEEQRAEVEALYTQLYASFQTTGVQLAFYQTKPLEPPASGAIFPVLDLAKETQDGSLWLALLARSGDLVEPTREAIAHHILTLGILPALTDASSVLLPGGPPSAEGQATLTYQIPLGGTLPVQPELRVARYKTLDPRPSGNLLTEPGVVQLPLPGRDELRLWADLDPLELGAGDFPPALEDAATQERVITWIRIRLPDIQLQSDIASQQLHARISWVGINAARVTQCAHVFAEQVGRGSGEPDQVVTLVNTPVLPGSVQLTVNGELWQEVENLQAAAPEVPVQNPRQTPGLLPAAPTASAQVYTLDRESGEIRFGNGIHGARPMAGALIQASYDFGGGRQGNVGLGAITKSPLLPAGVKVTNPLPTWGGDEAESASQAEQRIPSYLQHRDRLVSAEDFAQITWRTPGVDLGRVEVLSLFHPDLPDVLSDGVVTVLVIPLYDPVQPDTPTPDQLFLDTICAYLSPRRLVTTEVHVRGPNYVPLWVSVGIDVVAGRDVAPVREAVKEALRQFLSPLTGGFSETGWPLDKDVERLELWTVATRVDGVAKVNEVYLAGATGSSVDRITMRGLQLPQLLGLAVQPGDPTELADLRGDPGAPAADGGPTDGPPTRIVPVPVIPPECR